MRINRFAFATFAAVLALGVAVWTLEPGQAQEADGVSDARSLMVFGPPSSVVTTFVLAQADISTDSQALTEQDKSAADPIADESLPIERLSIVRQSMRRAGLGSRAIATFVLRNENDYPVKDIEVRCAFARVDGLGSTARVRTIDRTLKPKSREALPPTLIGHINVMAPKGKCALVSASRA